MMKRISKLLILLLLPINIIYAAEATSESSVEVSVDTIKPDKHNRRTPLGTVNGFLDALASDDMPRAVEYLNAKFAASDSEKKEVVKKLQYLLDHSGKFHANALISDIVDGNTADGLDLDKEDVGVVYIKDEKYPILLEQVNDVDNIPIWLFSAETLKTITKARSSKSNIINTTDYLPSLLNNNKVLGVPIGHWLTVTVLAVLVFFLAKLLIIISGSVIQKVFSSFITHEISIMILALSVPARLWLSVYLFITSLQYMSIPIIMRQHFNSVALAVYLVAGIILIWQITNIIHAITVDKVKKYNHAGLISIIDFLKKSIRFGLIIGGILLGLHLYDHNVTTGLAALGIGGLAIALGAQKTLENIAGSINVVADQTINQGDYCKVAGIAGYVEDIGIRSTKIRTLDRTLVTIPNSEFANHTLENFAKIDKRFYHQKIGVRYETSTKHLKYLVIKIQEMLDNHAMIDNNEESFVTFDEFGSDSLIIEIFAYINENKYFRYKKIKQDLNFLVMDIILESGTSFAFPSQTLYMSQDEGLDLDKTKSSEQHVESLMSENNLPLVNYSQDSLS